MAKKKTTPPATEAADISAQPYYLQRAHIKDFRSIRDAKVEFKPGLNIIIGANGSGKTNFVRVTSKGIDFINNEAASDATEFQINGHQSMKFVYSSSLIKKEFVLPSRNLQPGYKKFVTVITNKGEARGENLLSTILENYENIFPLRIPVVFYTLTIVHGLPKLYPIVTGQSEFVLEPLSVKDRTGPRLPAYILGAIERYVLNCTIEKTIDSLTVKKLEEVIYEIVNFFLSDIAQALNKYTNISDVMASDLLNVYYNKQQNIFTVRGLELVFRTNNEWLPFSALSSGSQRMFYIISELLVPIDDGSFRNSTRRYELEVEKIILLEEPELGIHPDQLHKLLLFLREQSEKHQIIITTHSPQVLDMLNEDELDRITICELDEKKGTQFRKLKKAQIATAKKFMNTEPGMFLSDYWRYGNLEGLH